MSVNIPLSLYIHIPWCIRKCPYCDFNSHAANDRIPEQSYITTLLSDLDQDLQRLGETRAISSIFLGGGTPSLFSPQSIDQLLSGIGQYTHILDDAEITLEANPGTFESNKFAEFRSLGINRLSIGIQSFNNHLLKRLGRVHDGAEAVKAAEIAHRAGFENFNIDLMFGLPDGTPETSRTDITTAIGLQPTHISFYQLTLEPNTFFYKFPPKLPNDDEIFNSQQDCQKQLELNGYQQYEISAFAQADQQCRHNINYWQYGDYLGIGAGAHGKITRAKANGRQISRYWKIKNPQQYLFKAGSEQIIGDSQTVADTQLALEFVMNHLRLCVGFDTDTLFQRTGLTLDALNPALNDCIEQNLLYKTDNTIRCTEKGWDFLDLILEKFIPA